MQDIVPLLQPFSLPCPSSSNSQRHPCKQYVLINMIKESHWVTHRLKPNNTPSRKYKDFRGGITHWSGSSELVLQLPQIHQKKNYQDPACPWELDTHSFPTHPGSMASPAFGVSLGHIGILGSTCTAHGRSYPCIVVHRELGHKCHNLKEREI